MIIDILKQTMALLTALLMTLQAGIAGLPNNSNVATVGQVLGTLTGAVYYVDNSIADTHVASVIPDCSNYNPASFTCGDGPAPAYKTVADINVGSFQPNDQILFRRGQVWREQLTTSSSGTSGNPITFGAYGNGAKPVLNGSDLMSGWIADGGWGTSKSWTPDAAFSDQQTRNWRNVIDAGMLSAGGTKIRVSLKATDGQTAKVDGMSICASAAGDDCDGIPTRITWGGGQNSQIFTSGQTLTSDEISFTVNTNTRYLINIYATNRNFVTTSVSGTGYYYNTAASDESQTQTVNYVFGAQQTTAINKIETYGGGGQANTWTVSGLSPSGSGPTQLFINGVRGAIKGSKAALTTNGDWYYGSGQLYLYSTTNPNLDTIEVTIRDTAITANRAYINLENLVATKGRLNGLWIITGSHVTTSNMDVSMAGASGISISEGSNVVTITGGSVFDNGYAADGDNNGIGTGGYGTVSTGMVIDGVYIYNNRNDQIEAYGPLGGLSDVTIKNCLIEGGSHNVVGGGIRVSGPGVGTITIQNNIIRNTYDHGIIAVGSAVPELRVYNNTIIGNRGAGIYAQNGNWVVKNNIIQNNGWDEITTDSTTGTFLSDYNSIWKLSGSSYFVWRGSNKTWEQWKISSGGDYHSINSDAMLNTNGSLKLGSPSINAGVNLGSPYNIGLSPDSVWPSSVSTLDQNSNGSGWEIGAYVYPSTSLPPSDTTTPSTPASLSATAISSSQINLSWTASTDNVGVTGYKIYRNNSQIGTSGTNSYSDTNLSPSTSYTYTVSAYDVAGNTSAQSSGVSATTLSGTTPPPPPPPTNSTKFSANQRIQTTSNLNVRSTASASGTLLGTQPLGSLGTIIGGGQSADGFYWWNVNYDNGVDGWSIEDYLTPYNASTPADKFIIGDRVHTTFKLKVRLTPTSTGKAICTQNKNAYGTVIAGPKVAGSYTWWQINYDSSCDGWSAENWLVK